MNALEVAQMVVAKKKAKKEAEQDLEMALAKSRKEAFREYCCDLLDALRPFVNAGWGLRWEMNEGHFELVKGATIIGLEIKYEVHEAYDPDCGDMSTEGYIAKWSVVGGKKKGFYDTGSCSAHYIKDPGDTSYAFASQFGAWMADYL